ncbi:MAG: site-2 protease family protein [Candidatus Hydrogenedentes bacterium]|nr:site-2 protease family protein [Candidatus Hydrogenedentota bacterium]
MDIDFGYILMAYFSLLFSLCVHEAAHAAMANWCGDPSARLLGRMTIDPRKHIDPLGTVALPLIMMFTGAQFLFGWAKPVPFNPRNLNNYRRDPVLIALAGPLSNVAMALTSAVLLRILLMLMAHSISGPVMPVLVQILGRMIEINVVLALFNMIPLPPLDGHHVLYYFLPQQGKEFLTRIGPMGIIIAIIFIVPMIQKPVMYTIIFLLNVASRGVMDLGEVIEIMYS